MGYIYVKNDIQTELDLPVSIAVTQPRKNKRIFAGILFFFGLILFGSAVFPILLFQVEYSSRFGQIINPLSPRYYNSGTILGNLSESDLTQLNNWFVTDNHTDASAQLSALSNSSSPTTYKLSIPTLKIVDATVEVGNMDLKKSLSQYPQTALPGQLGNGVVFGHSVLPQFFNPKSYFTIFATLYRLKQGDEIFIDYDNIRYKYLVEEMFEVSPTDLSVLEQRFDARYLTLITCSPPGTYLRRLIVKTRIADI